jgi:DNA-binding transcriptional MerR regulator
MAPKARIQKRLYYKIGEACKALGIQPYVLRYWETEFPALSPSKSRSGQRVYSEKELEIIRRIKQLLYDEGYTIAGAKKKLEGELAAGTLGEGAVGASAIAAAGAPSPFAVPGAANSAAAAAGTGAAGAAEPSPGRAPAPVNAVPLPLVPRAAAAPAQPALPVSQDAGGRTAAGGSAAGLSQPAPPTLPLSPPSPARAGAGGAPSRDTAPVPGEPAAGSLFPGEPAAGAPALGGSAPAAPTDRAPRARVTATADPSPAAAAPALDTAAAEQIETLRKGIHKALQEAREILALLDRSPH